MKEVTLRLQNDVHHHKIGETNEPSIYRVTDNARYSLEIHEWNGKKSQPYQADDVQLQFSMMSPYVLKTLSHDVKGLYFTEFQIPDVYGVFQFKVEQNRLGYTSLNLAKQIPVTGRSGMMSMNDSFYLPSLITELYSLR